MPAITSSGNSKLRPSMSILKLSGMLQLELSAAAEKQLKVIVIRIHIPFIITLF